MRLTTLASVLALTLVAPALTGAAGEAPKLGLPVACEIGRTCEVQHYVDRDAGPGVQDYRCGRRTYDGHNGVDIRILDMAAQRRGVDVLAAAPGTVARLRDGVADVSVRQTGLAAVAGQECGNGVVIDHGGGWETQYCHLAKGSIRVKPGQAVQAGTPLGRIGLSGQTEFPHLHLSVRQAGKVVDPFSPGPAKARRCAAEGSLWTPQAARALAYKEGVILNAGFAGAAIGAEAVEAGAIAPPTAASPLVVAYMRVIEVEKGDELELILRGPDGAVLAAQRLAPLDRDKAQYFAMIGRKRPASGWKAGRYAAEFTVWRGGKAVLRRTATTGL